MKVVKFALLIAIAALLAACGGDGGGGGDADNGGGGEDTVQDGPTTTPRPTIAPTPEPGMFSFEVDGTFNATISSEEANRIRFTAAPATTGGTGPESPATYRFNITEGRNNLQIRWSQDFESGEYDIEEAGSDIFIYFTPDGGARPTEFDDNVTGTLTLTIEDGVASGSIEFTAQADDALMEGDVIPTVTVTGTFEEWELPAD